MKWLAMALTMAALAGCRPAGGPPDEAVKDIAQSLFERAARGEDVPVPIPFTGQGTAAPRLMQTDIAARRKFTRPQGDVFEYDVRLTYLNRIEQLENSTVTIRFQRQGEIWQPSFPGPAGR